MSDDLITRVHAVMDRYQIDRAHDFAFLRDIAEALGCKLRVVPIKGEDTKIEAALFWLDTALTIDAAKATDQEWSEMLVNVLNARGCLSKQTPSSSGTLSHE